MPEGKGYDVEKGADGYAHSLLQSYRKNVSFLSGKCLGEQVNLSVAAS